jgi:hypothetical protein
MRKPLRADDIGWRKSRFSRLLRVEKGSRSAEIDKNDIEAGKQNARSVHHC